MSTLAASSSSATSSPRCVPFAFRRGAARRRLPAAGPGGGAPAAGGCGRPLCRPAEVIGGGIQSAFFASLDRCSCVEIRTKSFKEPEPEPDAVPLVSPTPLHDDSGSAAAAGCGGRRSASAGGKPRRGLGCCTPTSAN